DIRGQRGACAQMPIMSSTGSRFFSPVPNVLGLVTSGSTYVPKRSPRTRCNWSRTTPAGPRRDVPMKPTRFPTWSSGQLAVQDLPELRPVDVAARDDAHDPPRPPPPRERRRDRRGAGALGDDPVAFDEEADRVGDRIQRHRERAVEEAAHDRPHLGEQAL